MKKIFVFYGTKKFFQQQIVLNMNKETRIQKIDEIINRDKDNPFNKIEIPWEELFMTVKKQK